MANTFSLGRNWQEDGAGRQYRVVTEEGRGIGRVYQHRFRFTRLGKLRNGFRFEFNGLPTRDPIFGKTLGEIYDRLLELKRARDAADHKAADEITARHNRERDPLGLRKLFGGH